MIAMPDNVIPFAMPKRPRILIKEALPDQRKLSVIPIRAGTDTRLHGGTLRTLIVLCSFCNRAGLTWVGQAKIGEKLGISRQAVTKQMAILVKCGYVVVIKKGFRAERANTIRVIFDDSIDTETAIAVTSRQENNRPPSMEDTPDIAGLRRIANLMANLPNQPPTRSATMPTSGTTKTVQRIKDDIAKATAKRTSRATHRQPLEVAHEEGLHTQPHRQPHRQLPEVAQREVNGINGITIIKSSTKLCLGNLALQTLIDAGMTERQIESDLAVLVPLFQAEGIEPSDNVLVSSILQMRRDVR